MATAVLCLTLCGTVSNTEAQMVGQGIGGYDMSSTADKGFAFDFSSSGKQDHMIFYRPGEGIVWAIQNIGGQFSPSFVSSSGIGGYNLNSPADRGFALDLTAAASWTTSLFTVPVQVYFGFSATKAPHSLRSTRAEG
jgi:hypothetical protein